MPSGDVALSAVFDGTIKLPEGTLVGPESGGLFLARVDGNAGVTKWARAIGGPGGRVGGIVEANAAGHLLISGAMLGMVDLGGGPLLDPNGAPIKDAAYLLGLDGDGTFRWQHALDGEIAAPDPCGGAFLASVCQACGEGGTGVVQVRRLAP
jgi:hypothetical protein